MKTLLIIFLSFLFQVTLAENNYAEKSCDELKTLAQKTNDDKKVYEMSKIFLEKIEKEIKHKNSKIAQKIIQATAISTVAFFVYELCHGTGDFGEAIIEKALTRLSVITGVTVGPALLYSAYQDYKDKKNYEKDLKTKTQSVGNLDDKINSLEITLRDIVSAQKNNHCLE